MVTRQYTLSPTCRRGHLRTAKDVRVRLRPDGGLHITCRLCQNMTNVRWQNDKYRNDAAYRKIKCAKANAYAHAHRVLKRNANASV